MLSERSTDELHPRRKESDLMKAVGQHNIYKALDLEERLSCESRIGLVCLEVWSYTGLARCG